MLSEVSVQYIIIAMLPPDWDDLWADDVDKKTERQSSAWEQQHRDSLDTDTNQCKFHRLKHNRLFLNFKVGDSHLWSTSLAKPRSCARMSCYIVSCLNEGMNVLSHLSTAWRHTQLQISAAVGTRLWMIFVLFTVFVCFCCCYFFVLQFHVRGINKWCERSILSISVECLKSPEVYELDTLK